MPISDSPKFILDDSERIEDILQAGLFGSELYYDHNLIREYLRCNSELKSIDLEIESVSILYKFSNEIRRVVASSHANSTSVFNKQIGQMKQIMKRLDLITNEDVPNQKGKVASLVQGCDELLLTETIY